MASKIIEVDLDLRKNGLTTSASSVAAASTTTILRTIPLSSFRTLKWHIKVEDTTNNIVVSSEVSVTTDGVAVTHCEYSVQRFGGDLNFTLNVLVSSGNALLNILNIETEALQVNVLKIASI